MLRAVVFGGPGLMDSGVQVLQTLIEEVVIDAVGTVGDHWVLHRFPRTVQQAEPLAQSGHPPTVVIELVLDEQETMTLAWLEGDPLAQRCREERMVAITGEDPGDDGWVGGRRSWGDG